MGTAAHNLSFKLLENGAEYFPALVQAIEAAQTEIYLETFIFYADPAGEKITHALCAAAKRGVQVKMVVDWLGTRHFDGGLREQLINAGVQFRLYNRFFIGKQGVTRTHRKLVLIDAEHKNVCAFVGGINLTDDFYFRFKPLLKFPRWDFAVQIVGQTAGQAEPELIQEIALCCQQQWRRLAKLSSLERYESLNPKFPAQVPKTPRAVFFVVRDNFRHRRAIEKAYLRAIGQARQQVLIANPYFFPSQKFKKALIHAAARGVEVVLLLGKKELPLQDLATEALYDKLLKAKIKIFEYHRSLLHAKVAVVDEAWATVGSSNCDGLSLLLNLEANLVVQDAAFVKNLRQKILQGLSHSVQIEAQSTPAFKRRLIYTCAYFLYQATIKVMSLARSK